MYTYVYTLIDVTLFSYMHVLFKTTHIIIEIPPGVGGRSSWVPSRRGSRWGAGVPSRRGLGAVEEGDTYVYNIITCIKQVKTELIYIDSLYVQVRTLILKVLRFNSYKAYY